MYIISELSKYIENITSMLSTYRLLFPFFVQLSFDLIETWLEEHPEVLGLKKNEESVFRQLALFQDYHGLPAFKDVSNINSSQYILGVFKPSFSFGSDFWFFE